MTLDEWVQLVARDLSVQTFDVTPVLDLTRDVAHGVARPAAPLTCLVIGMAVGAGQPLDEVLEQVRRLVPPVAAQPG